MLNTQNTTNQTSQARSNRKATKRGYTRTGTHYFVIEVKTNEKVNINNQQNAILHDWLELKAQESDLKEQLDAMKSAVVEVVSEIGGGVFYRGFEFTTKVRRTYQFSAEVNDLEIELKARKAVEIKNEIAECTRQTEFIEVRVIEK